MAAPFEIVAAPVTLYVAPAGESFPAIDASVAGNWVMIGTTGAENYDDEGVTAGHEQSLEFFRGAGSAAPKKAFRTEEDFIFGLTLVDLSPDQYAKTLDAAVTTVSQSAGVAGQKHFSFLRGIQVASFAVLARGLSTVDDALNSQYEVSLAVQEGNPSPVYTKGEPAGLELSYRALKHSSTGIGKLRTQTTVAG